MQKIPVTRDKKSSDIFIIPSDEVVKIECIRDKEYIIHTVNDKFYWAASLEAFEEWLFEEGFRLIDQMNVVNMNHVTEYESRKGTVKLQPTPASPYKTASAAWIHSEHITNVISLLRKMKDLDHGIPEEEDDIFETILAQEEDHRFARSYAMIKALYEKRKAEILLEESELRYKSLFEHNPDPICSFNLNGQITSINPVMYAATGYTEQELLNKTIDALLFPEHYTVWSTNFLLTLGGTPSHYEIAFRRKDGHRIELSMHSFPIFVGKQIAGVFMIGQDISERKRAEEMLLRSEKLSVVGQMAAGVAHEIRNPLTSLKGFVQLMQSRVDGFDHYFNIMLEELERINFIVSEFLVIAKPQAVLFQPRDPVAILQNTILLTGSQAIIHNVHIDTLADPDLPMINCDENQIKQVFINILNNSVDSMKDGGTIKAEFKLNADGRVLMRFTDQGCGIPDDRISRLGEPFYTTKEKGTGLGLMVTFKIIENHGGEMKIRSKLGQGTTVEIYMPAVKPPEAPPFPDL
ncbi:two-component system, sporulation sensor kinase E [Paenibacillus sp. UNCCL117]|uniref:ATP-binding protein n=1 Tax=unclassified Paenibacillus TaxID=185978 RepID=UPI0008871122|nr:MULTISPECIES: ATP-binding protein [unclassified Paenibacillus]SDC03907.1 transcriptional regulator, LytTR family [Paenibacillus sp. cl123]SFW37200.1 two-component system, sporulation sensor kinase E [Paenibacillus sp. UNCCL117]